MKFKRLKVKNIRSYEDEEIIFPEGSLLLAGDIGSGKSSILLAIEYALFGLQPGQKGAALLRNTEEVGEVELELNIDEKTVLLERKLKRTPKGVSNDYASITINGEKSESSVTEIKAKIVQLLGYPQEYIKKNNILYRYTVYTPQEQMKQIIQEDAETRKNILRHVFGIDKYKIIRENTTLVLTTLKSDAKFIQGEVNTIDQDRDNFNHHISRLNLVEGKLKATSDLLSQRAQTRKDEENELKILEGKIAEKHKYEQELAKTKVMFSTKKEYIQTLSRQIEELHHGILEAGPPFNQAKFNDIQSELLRFNEQAEKLRLALADCHTHTSSLDTEEKEILRKKERIFKIDICPTCLQDVSDMHKHNILNETETRLMNIKKEKNKLREEQEVISKNLNEIKFRIAELEKEKVRMEIQRSRHDFVERSKIKLMEVERNRESLILDCQLLEKHITGIKETILRYNAFEVNFRQQREIVKHARLEEKNVEIALAELNKERELMNLEITLLKESIERKEEKKQKLYALQELIDWLSNQFLHFIDFTERNVLLRLRNEFSRLFRKWFLMLVTDNSIDAQLDDTFTPIIIQKEAEMDYDFLSGGERTAVALAYRLALNQTVNSILSNIKTRGIIILDEPTDGFSDTQIDKVRDILDELNATQLILVSHEPKIEGFVDHVMRITKIEGDSSIESVAPQIPAAAAPQNLNTFTV